MTSRVVIPVLEGLEQNERPLVKQVVKGIKQIQEQQINSQTHSTTQTTFNFQPPSQNTVIDRNFVLSMKVALAGGGANTLQSSSLGVLSADGAAAGTAGANAQTCGFSTVQTRVPTKQIEAGAEAISALDLGKDGADFVQSNNLAPKQFPLANCMNSIDLVINGTHFSVSVSQYLSAIMTYTSPEWRTKHLADTYHCPNACPSSNFTQFPRLNPAQLSETGCGFVSGEEPNGKCFAFQGSSPHLVSVNADSSILTFDFREPLFISPLMSYLGYGMTNINQLDITIRWNANLLGNMFQYKNAGSAGSAFANGGYIGTNVALTNASVSFPETQAQLHVRYYTPQDDVNIPNEIVLPYKQPQIEVQALSGNAPTSVVSNNVRLNQIPESCYVFVRTRKSAEVATIGETYGRIKGINIRWKNQTGILSGFSQKDLIQLSQTNGLWYPDDVALQNGCVLKLNFGEDIPLDDNESPGTRGDYNWQLEISSLTTDDVTGAAAGGVAASSYELVQVFVLNGHAIISPNECRVATGVLSLEENMGASDMGHSYSTTEGGLSGGELVGGAEVGGNLIGGMAKHIKRLARVAPVMLPELAKTGKCVADGVRGAVDAYKSRA